MNAPKRYDISVFKNLQLAEPNSVDINGRKVDLIVEGDT